jgi:hypothetical protein
MKRGRKLSVAAEAAVGAAEAAVVMVAAAMAVEAAAAAEADAAEIVETAETAGKRPSRFGSDVFIPRDAAGNLPSKCYETGVRLPAVLSLATFDIEVRLREEHCADRRRGAIPRRLAGGSDRGCAVVGGERGAASESLSFAKISRS